MEHNVNDYVYVDVIGGWLPFTAEDVTPLFITDDEDILKNGDCPGMKDYKAIGDEYYGFELKPDRYYYHAKSPYVFGAYTSNGCLIPFIGCLDTKSGECGTFESKNVVTPGSCIHSIDGSSCQLLFTRKPLKHEVVYDNDIRQWNLGNEGPYVDVLEILERESRNDEPWVDEVIEALAISSAYSRDRLDCGLTLRKAFFKENLVYDHIVAAIPNDSELYDQVLEKFNELSRKYSQLFTYELDKDTVLYVDFKYNPKVECGDIIANVTTVLNNLYQHFTKDGYVNKRYIFNGNSMFPGVVAIDYEDAVPITDLKTQLRDSIKHHVNKEYTDGSSLTWLYKVDYGYLFRYAGSLEVYLAVVNVELGELVIGYSNTDINPMHYRTKGSKLSEFERHFLKRGVLKKFSDEGSSYIKDNLNLKDSIECFIEILKGEKACN